MTIPTKKKAVEGFIATGSIFVVAAIIMKFTIIAYLYDMALWTGIVLLVLTPVAWFWKAAAKHSKALGGLVFILFFLTLGLGAIISNVTIGGTGPGQAAPFSTPLFYDGQTQLNNNNMYLYVVGVRNDSGAAVLRYEGAASGLTAVSQILPAAGSVYSFTYIQGWVWGSDTGALATAGVFKDQVTRTYKNFAFLLPPTGTTIVHLVAYRNVAPVVYSIFGVNNTIATATTLAAGKPVHCNGGSASNFTVIISPSQSYKDTVSNIGYEAFSDYVNGSAPTTPATNTPLKYSLYLSIAGCANMTDAIIASSVKVTCNGNVLTALQNVGAALTDYYALPTQDANGLVVGHAPVSVQVAWTVLGEASSYTITTMPAIVYGASTTPSTAYYTL